MAQQMALKTPIAAAVTAIETATFWNESHWSTI
jgi:hypothetical protein